jgi:integration host factor subunit beta
MNKSEIIKALAEQNNLQTDEATRIVNIFFQTIKDALIRGDRVEIRGFGSFKIKDYQGYNGRNPRTGQSVQVQPKRLPFFRPGKELKDFLNQ